MKYNELYKKLRKAECFLLHHGARHDGFKPVFLFHEEVKI